MPDAREVANELLKEHGCELVRQRKHEIYKLPNGKVFTRASTPSDVRADKNSLTILRDLLGIQEERGIPGERRERKPRRRAMVRMATPLSNALPVNESLRDKILAIVRRTKPKYQDCYPMEKVTVLRTPLTVLLTRIFG